MWLEIILRMLETWLPMLLEWVLNRQRSGRPLNPDEMQRLRGILELTEQVRIRAGAVGVSPPE